MPLGEKGPGQAILLDKKSQIVDNLVVIDQDHLLIGNAETVALWA